MNSLKHYSIIALAMAMTVQGVCGMDLDDQPGYLSRATSYVGGKLSNAKKAVLNSASFQYVEKQVNAHPVAAKVTAGVLGTAAVAGVGYKIYKYVNSPKQPQAMTQTPVASISQTATKKSRKSRFNKAEEQTQAVAQTTMQKVTGVYKKLYSEIEKYVNGSSVNASTLKQEAESLKLTSVINALNNIEKAKVKLTQPVGKKSTVKANCKQAITNNLKTIKKALGIQA